MSYHVETACDQGVVRTNNEDAICYGMNESLNFFWMLIADGVGGHKAGEVASDFLADHIEQAFEQLSQVPEQGWQLWVKLQLQLANEGIFKLAQSQNAYQGMSTTGVLLVIERHQCHLAWVGDSRAYLLADSQLTQLTKDHTMIQYLVDKGAITAEEAEKSNTKNLLSKAIGSKEEVEVDSLSKSVNSGDSLMLSTDGLHDYLSNKQLAKYMENSNINHSVCSDMISQSIAQSSRDNITVGIIKI